MAHHQIPPQLNAAFIAEIGGILMFDFFKLHTPESSELYELFNNTKFDADTAIVIGSDFEHGIKDENKMEFVVCLNTDAALIQPYYIAAKGNELYERIKNDYENDEHFARTHHVIFISKDEEVRTFIRLFTKDSFDKRLTSYIRVFTPYIREVLGIK